MGSFASAAACDENDELQHPKARKYQLEILISPRRTEALGLPFRDILRSIQLLIMNARQASVSYNRVV